jgi:hypothetical protein
MKAISVQWTLVKSVAFFVVLALATSACSKQTASETQSADDDLTATGRPGLVGSVPNSLNSVTRSAIFISFKDDNNEPTFCTGTHNKGRIITSSHCKINCAAATLTYWIGLKSHMAKCSSSDIGPGNDLLTLVTLDKGLIASGSLALDVSKMKPVKGEQVRVYYFKPGGKLTEASGCVIKEIRGTSVEHNCSTQPGASGALVVSHQDPSRILAVHQDSDDIGANGGTFGTEPKSLLREAE